MAGLTPHQLANLKAISDQSKMSMSISRSASKFAAMQARREVTSASTHEAIAGSVVPGCTDIVQYSGSSAGDTDTELTQLLQQPLNPVHLNCATNESLLAAESWDEFYRHASSAAGNRCPYPVSEQQLTGAWKQQLGANIAWKDACKSFAAETSRIARPPTNSDDTFPKKVKYPSFCGFNGCKSSLEYQKQLKLTVAFHDIVSRLGGPESFANTDVLLSFECILGEGPDCEVKQYVYAWMTSPLNRYLTSPPTEVFIKCYVSDELEDYNQETFVGLIITDSQCRHVENDFDKLPVKPTDITSGTLVHYTEMEMAKLLCSFKHGAAHVTSVRIKRILFEDINMSTVVSVGLCDKFEAIDVSLDIRPSPKKGATAAPTSTSLVTASAASSSSSDPPKSSAASSHGHSRSSDIDFAQMLSDQPPVCEPAEDTTDSSWDFGTDELSSKVYDYVLLLDREWDINDDNPDILLARDAEMNDAEFDVLKGAMDELKIQAAVESRKDVVHLDVDAELEHCSSNLFEESHASHNDDEAIDETFDAGEAIDEAVAESGCDVSASCGVSSSRTSHEYFKDGLGFVRVEYVSPGQSVCTVSYRPIDSGPFVSIGSVNVMLTSEGHESTVANCTVPGHKRCKCWLSKPGHVEELIDWLVAGPGSSASDHADLSYGLKSSLGMRPRRQPN